jgi:hypothetical protein
MPENMVPFNSSGKRMLDICSGEGVGVGLYNNPGSPSWGKKSYNAKLN